MHVWQAPSAYSLRHSSHRSRQRHRQFYSTHTLPLRHLSFQTHSFGLRALHTLRTFPAYSIHRNLDSIHITTLIAFTALKLQNPLVWIESTVHGSHFLRHFLCHDHSSNRNLDSTHITTLIAFPVLKVPNAFAWICTIPRQPFGTHPSPVKASQRPLAHHSSSC